MSRGIRCTLVALMSVGPLLLPVTPAPAGDLDCTLTNHVVTLNLTTDHATVFVYLQEGELWVTSGFTFYPCDGATVNNTDKIRILDTVAKNDAEVTLDFRGGPFAPGFTNEDGSSDEIEFVVKLGDGDNRFTVQGAEDAVNVRVGTTRVEVGDAVKKRREINLNAGEESHVDHDVVVAGNIFVFHLIGSSSGDHMGAHGGAGTGDPYIGPIGIYGTLGSDVLRGGLNDDDMNGGNQKCVECFPDADRVFGGEGNDHLRGGKGPDRIFGEKGQDTIEGDEGNDELYGGPGPDLLNGADGDDVLDGGGGDDNCHDGPGDDTLVSCEV